MVLAAEIVKEVKLPEGVTVSIEGANVTVQGPKGQIQRSLVNNKISVNSADNIVKVKADRPKRAEKALVGTITAHINNMVKGVNEGFEYKLIIFYKHFPMTVKVQGKEIVINNFLGEKYPRTVKIVGNTKVEVKGQEITVSGINKEEVGQTAGNLKLKTKIGRKDPRVFKDGIFLISKGDEQ